MGARSRGRRVGAFLQHARRVVLRLLHVGLVEGVDAQRPARHRGGELGEEEDPAEVGSAVHSERQRRVPGAGERLHLGVGVRVGVVGVAQVGEHAVVAVGVRVAERLAGHRQDALPLLAGRLGDQLLHPEAEARDRLGHDEGGLVAPLRAPARPSRSPSRGRSWTKSSRSACSSARPPGRDGGAPPRSRRPAPPARARSTTAPSSGRRCPGRSRTRGGSRARARGPRAGCPGR